MRAASDNTIELPEVRRTPDPGVLSMGIQSLTLQNIFPTVGRENDAVISPLKRKKF